MNDVLVLNFTYEVLNITSFQRAVKLIFSGKAEVVHGRDHRLVSPSFEMRMLPDNPHAEQHSPADAEGRPDQKNILLRDNYTCQYCGLKGERMMTVDHVHPRSKGGPSTWEKSRLRLHALQQPEEQPDTRARQHAAQAQAESAEVYGWMRVKRNTLPGEWHKFLFLYNVSIGRRMESTVTCRRPEER